MAVAEHLKSRLYHWHETMRREDQEKAVRLKEELEPLIFQSKHHELKEIYQLLQIRFYLLQRDDAEVLKCFSDIGSARNLKNEEQKYYYFFFNAIFLYENKHYQSSIENFLKAEPYMLKRNNSNETADFKYKLSMAYYRSSHFLNSMQLAKEALDLYQRNRDRARCADCENIIAANIQHLDRNDQAEIHYLKALKWIEKESDPKRYSIYYSNLGKLYAEHHLPESAINCLLKSRKYMGSIPQRNECTNIFILAKENFKTGNLAEAWHWLEEGLKRSRENGDEEYQLHFQLLAGKHEQNIQLFEEEYERGILYFRQKCLWKPLMAYSKELARHYERQQRFKEASRYYDTAFEALDMMQKEGIR